MTQDEIRTAYERLTVERREAIKKLEEINDAMIMLMKQCGEHPRREGLTCPDCGWDCRY